MRVSGRKSNIELLRCILLLMVITLHYNSSGMGNAFEYVEHNTLNYYISYFLESLSICAVDCFILITGYFMIINNKRCIRKVIDLLFLVLFYNIILYFISILIQLERFNFRNLVIALKQGNWFIFIYIALYLITPFINKMITTISKKDFKRLLIILFVLFSIYPTILDFIGDLTQVSTLGLGTISLKSDEGGYTIVNFIMFYLIGAYIRLYLDEIKLKYNNLLIFCAAIIIFIGSLFSITFWNYNNFFVLISAVLIFIKFKNIKIVDNKVINYISQSMISVYLIHTNGLMCNDFWSIFNFDYYIQKGLSYYILNYSLAVFSMFIICVIFDKICQSILIKPIQKPILDRIKLINYSYEIK